MLVLKNGNKIYPLHGQGFSYSQKIEDGRGDIHQHAPGFFLKRGVLEFLAKVIGGYEPAGDRVIGMLGIYNACF